VLAIVENQANGFALHEFDEAVGQYTVCCFPQAERGGYGMHYVCGIDQRCELDEPCAIGVVLRGVRGYTDSQTRLAATTRASQGEQPSAAKEMLEFLDFSLATDEAGLWSAPEEGCSEAARSCESGYLSG
jgi:hypothetical protein